MGIRLGLGYPSKRGWSGLSCTADLDASRSQRPLSTLADQVCFRPIADIGWVELLADISLSAMRTKEQYRA
jgi:hypothetical protein